MKDALPNNIDVAEIVEAFRTKKIQDLDDEQRKKIQDLDDEQRKREERQREYKETETLVAQHAHALVNAIQPALDSIKEFFNGEELLLAVGKHPSASDIKLELRLPFLSAHTGTTELTQVSEVTVYSYSPHVIKFKFFNRHNPRESFTTEQPAEIIVKWAEMIGDAKGRLEYKMRNSLH